MIKTPNTPPILVNQGGQVEASYQEQLIPDYQGNPLIEALSQILTANEAARQLAHFPIYDEEQRNAPDHLRFHLIQCGLRFFTPLPIHQDLERRFSCLIRGGYAGRNPMRHGFYSELGQKISTLNSGRFKPNYVWSTCAGFSIIGMSGMGKTRAVESILNLYPQIIYHSKYIDRDFNQSQIVWLKLDCPYDGNPRGVCTNFFQQVDHILGTDFRGKFGKERRLADVMLVDMANIAAQHFLGVLVIDEIQRLSRAKSGGSGKLLDFFVQLINTIGVPVILIGTYKALSILSREFSQIRRGTGQGDLVWDRMEEDDIWHLFVKSLWKYQYTNKACLLEKNPHLSHVLYEETQGITDFAVKVYMLAQVRAITSGKEIITAGIIRSVAKDSLRTAARVLDALRRRDNRVLEEFDDIPFIDFETYWRKAINSQNGSQQTPLPPSLGENALQPKAQESNATSNPISDVLQKPPNKTNSKRSGRSQSSICKGELAQVASEGATHGLTAYEALRRKGFIRPSGEYF